jgi:elongation factor 1-beta
MGDVIAVFRVMPESLESFDSVKAALERLGPDRLEEEPVAFGLKALKFTKFVPDEEGTLAGLEDSLNKIEGVQSVETVTVSRSL